MPIDFETGKQIINSKSAGIGDAIRRERKKAGLNQGELAERLDVTRSLIGQYERGVRNPKPSTIQRIADALGVPFTALAPVSADQTPEEKAAAVDQLINDRLEAAKNNLGIEYNINIKAGVGYINTGDFVSFEVLADDLSKRNGLPWLVMALYRTGNMKALVQSLYNTGTFEPMMREINALADQIEKMQH